MYETPRKNKLSKDEIWIKINKLTSRNCDLNCCLNLLPLSVGWDIMVYESEPLPNHI